MTRRPNTSILIRPVKDKDTDRNFSNVESYLADLGPAAQGQVTDRIALTAGDNAIKAPLARPLGRITVYQDAVSDITDKGFVNGKWVVTSSAACNVIFLFI